MRESAFFFDDNEPSANELAELVVQGVKRATAASLWAYEAESKELPKPGHLSVVTEFSGKPVCVIETESVSVTPFAEVGATFAATEGEGDVIQLENDVTDSTRGHAAFLRAGCVAAL